MTIALAAALSASHAWAADVAASQTSSYDWLTGGDPDLTILSGVSIAATAPFGSSAFSTPASSSGTLGTFTNQGTVSNDGGSGGGNSFTNNANITIGQVNNTATGVISVSCTYSCTALSNYGSIGALTNAGLISSVGGVGLLNQIGGSIGALNNSGSISGLRNNGSITSLINSAAAGRIGYLENFGSVDTLSNFGTIGGGASNTGLLNSGTITTLNNSGLITGSATGLSAANTIGTLNNSGTITTSNYAGMSVSGTVAVLNNSGLITTSGGGAGLSVNGIITVLNNSGLIAAAGGGNALYVSNTGSIPTFINSGTIAGHIQNDRASALGIIGGSGTVFGTLMAYGGGIGLITSNAGVSFNGGNQFLNDNIVASVVTNAAGVLQVNNRITITGNYNQSAAATLNIGVNNAAVSNGVIADTGYGRLIVSGTATVASGSNIALTKLNTYSFASGQRFVVIQANAATYNAASLNYSAAGFAGTATGATVTDSGYQVLVVTLGDKVGNLATNGNASTVLNALFNYKGVNQSLLNVFNPAAALSDPNAANRAGAQLSPTATASAAASGATAAFGAVQGAATGRVDGMRLAQTDGADTSTGASTGSGGVATGESALDPGLWGRAFGGQSNQGARDGISGYHGNYGGVLIGADAQVNLDWRVGGLFSYGHINVGNDGDNAGSSASVNTTGVMAYAGFDGKPWYLNLTAGVSRQQYSTTRNIAYTGFSGVANGSYKGSLYSVSAQAGFPLTLNAYTLTPLSGLHYKNLRQDGYTESGGNGAALTVGGSSINSLKSEFGAKLDRSFATSYGALTPFTQLSWHHEFLNSTLTTNASFAADTSGATAFTAHGATPQRDTAQLSLGATLLRSKNLSLSARYTVEAASGYTAQTGDLSLRWQY